MADIDKQKILSILQEVYDPEVPVLSITDLGIVRDVKTRANQVEVLITPTYSGCPAMDAIGVDIKLKLAEKGYKEVVVTSILSPAWTTEWMSEAGKEKLKAYGIAPPNPKQIVCEDRLFAESEAIQCPQCNSYHTNSSAGLGQQPARLYTIVRIVRSPLIILNVIDPPLLYKFSNQQPLCPQSCLTKKIPLLLLRLAAPKSLTLSTGKWPSCCKKHWIIVRQIKV